MSCNSTAPIALPYNGASAPPQQLSRTTPFHSYPTAQSSSQSAYSAAVEYQPTFPHFKHRYQAAPLIKMQHLPAIAHRDRPTTATSTANLTSSSPPPASTSPSTSPRSASASDPSNPRHLNPLKFAKPDRKHNTDNKHDDSQLNLWYMTQPGEDRYWMYEQNGTEMKLIKQRLAATFNRRCRRPHTPIEPPSAAFPAPTSESVRARLNLLKWLSSQNCLLFYECDEVVEVDDVQLDTVLSTAHSTTDGGAKVIQILMRWSKEGRRYAEWAEVQSDVERLMAEPGASGATEGGQEKEAMKRVVEEENRRKDKLHERIERERQERFTALRKRQAEERAVRVQRKAEKDQKRTAVAQRRQVKKLAALDRAASTTSTVSEVSMADSVKVGGRRGGKGQKADVEVKEVSGAEDEREEEEQKEQVAQRDAGVADEQADETYDNDDKYTEAESADSADNPDIPSSHPSSGATSERSTPSDKEAQEEKQPDNRLAIDTPHSDEEGEEVSARPVVSAVSSTRPSSRVPALLTLSPRTATAGEDEVVAERVSARERLSARGDKSSSRPGSAREKASDGLTDTSVQ